ncbi:MAG: hypothetical protein LBE35_08780 [Clostridiales bacterium]|nr:hypothetical protein [Clostridiales bacterium]
MNREKTGDNPVINRKGPPIFEINGRTPSVNPKPNPAPPQPDKPKPPPPETGK